MTDNRDNDNVIKTCHMCHRSEDKAGKMLTLPGGLNVCVDCLQRTLDTMQASGFNPSSLGLNMDLMPFMGMPVGTPQGAGNQGGSSEPPEQLADTGVFQGEVVDNDKENPDGGNESQNNDGQQPPKRPGISFINVADFQNAFNRKPQVKKRKPGDKKTPLIDPEKILPPHKLKEKLDEYVIGQDQAKKIISVAVYNHYKRVMAGSSVGEDGVEIEKSNMLIIGPTGCGKTHIVRTLANLLDVPLAITDATSLTEAGYIGDDIESVLSKLLAAADNDVDKAEVGIVFIDEIDKIAKKNSTRGRDVSGESVQQGLLKLLEGSEVEVPVGATSKNAMVPLTTMNTKNVLFICGGAFPGLDEMVKERLNKNSSIGFMADLKDKYDKDKNVLDKVETEDVRKFGMIPEFLGRLPILCTLQELDEEMLVQVLKEPKNAILKQYQKLLELDEVKLEFEDDALLAITKKAQEKEMGARGLRSIIEKIMLDIMFEIPKDDSIGTVTITKDYVEGTGGPIIGIRSNDTQFARPMIAESEQNAQ